MRMLSPSIRLAGLSVLGAIPLSASAGQPTRSGGWRARRACYLAGGDTGNRANSQGLITATSSLTPRGLPPTDRPEGAPAVGRLRIAIQDQERPATPDARARATAFGPARTRPRNRSLEPARRDLLQELSRGTLCGGTTP